jgi:predicted permease
MLSDFRLAFRTLAKTPGFTVVALLTLALAIGVNTAVFTLVNSLLLRPTVPLRPAEVVNVFTARAGASREYRQFSHAEYLALRDNKDVFADVAAINFILAGIGRDDGIRRSFAFFVSENFFPLLGARPVAGRFFTAEESRPNANIPVVVASHGLWRQYGGKPDFVGSSLRVNGQMYTVIGVTPEGFSNGNAVLAPELWLPLGMFSSFAAPFSGAAAVVDLANPRNYTLNLTARLQPGVTLEAARARLPGAARRLTAIQPTDATGERELQIQPPSRFNISTQPSNDSASAPLVLVLHGMAACVLLIASLNLANMLLARGTGRAREVAVRMALGASRWRVVRQLLAEGLLLAIGGGALGLMAAIWCNDLLIHSISGLLSSMHFSFVVSTRPDAAVLVVTLLFSIAATLVFSLGPALRTSRVDLVHDLKQQTGEPAADGRLNRFFALRHCLVMGQIALSLMLLFSAGLFFRGALNAGGLDLGFEPKGQVVAEIDFSLANTGEGPALQAIFRAVDRVRELPGVRQAALSTLLPYGNVDNDTRVMPASAAPVAKGDKDAPQPGASASFCATTPGYFEAMRVRLLRGRDFTLTEARDKAAPRVAIVDETLARELFPKGDALGQRIRYTESPADGSPAEMEIVGVVSRHRQEVLRKTDLRRLFVPLAASYNANLFLHVRLDSDDPAAAAAAVATLRTALRELDPKLPVVRIAPYSRIVEQNLSLWIVRLGAILFGLFGGLALALATVGVYGVKAYAVARRTREIGIRMAIGAQPADVLKLVLRQGALQTAVALVAGLLLAIGAGQLLASLLYRVSPLDPVSLLAAASVLSVAALLACYLPARQAATISPLSALRSE